MLSLGLSCLLFLFLALVGRATLAAFSYRRSVLRAWLLAPTVGLAVLLAGVMVLNQAGLPVRSFAWVWGLALLGFSMLILWRRRPVFPRRQLLVLGLLLMGSLVWTGWPALKFGFNWVSYANDDMANYCLAAERFADKGFFDVPTSVDINLRDYTEIYWYMHAADLMRFGSEHLVSWTLSVADLKATQAFMPVILMLGLVQVCSAAGLVLHKGRHRRWALLSAAILAISPLFMLGTLYQLIAQVGGLALLMCILALLTERPDWRRKAWRIRDCALIGLVAAILCIYYPEVTPFLGLSFLGFLGLKLWTDRADRSKWVEICLYTTAFTLLYLNFNTLSYVYTLLKQFASAVRSNDITLTLFPYFLVPTGFSNLYGWMPFTHAFAAPIPLITVISGILLTLLILGSLVRESLRGIPMAILGCVQFVLAVKLFTGANDFGLYKLAMFMQPALAAGMAWWFLRAPRPERAAPWLAAGYFATTIASALSYTGASLGLKTGSITELQYASLLGVKASPPKEILDRKPAGILSTIDNVAAAKFAASELRGHDVAFVARDFFSSGMSNGRYEFRKLHPQFRKLVESDRLELEHMTDYVSQQTLWGTSFLVQRAAEKAEFILSPATQLSLYNKFGHTGAGIPESLFSFSRLGDVHNFLVFVHSGQGNHYYLGDRRRIAIFQQEPDPFLEGAVFSGMGRFMLMRVENADEEIYLRLSLTRTLMPSHKPWLAEGVVHGRETTPLGLAGHGAVNRIIGPLRPLRHEGASYIAIDFRENAKALEDRRSGILALYNREVPMDFRRLVGWGRDISALSKSQYADLKRPTEVSHFPEDIVHAEGLEFTGAYEDGWVSPVSEWTLGPSTKGGYLRVRGDVPGLPGAGGTLSVSIGEQPAFEAAVPPGAFEYCFPVAESARATKVRLAFSGEARLPGDDARVVGARLRLLGIEAASEVGEDVFDYTQPGSPRLPFKGADQDGWLMANASLLLPSGWTELLLVLECPGWQDEKGQQVRIQLPDGSQTTRSLHAGENELRLQLPAAAGHRLLSLTFDREFQLPGADGRKRSVRLHRIETPRSANQP